MHPYVPELKDQYRRGKVTRREFMEMAAMLGLSLSGISAFLTSCAPKETETPTGVPPTATSAAVPTATSVPPTPTPVPTEAGGPKRGGQLVVQSSVGRIDDPATSGDFNLLRLTTEWLVVLNQDNVVVPWLLEKWEPSDDLKTWTLYVRQGVKFNNGADFAADDVIFNLQRWLDPEVGSGMFDLLSPYLSPSNIEEVDDYTVRLHLDKPQIAMPQHFSGYICGMVSKDFEGNWVDNPVGTGPYNLDEFLEGERAVLKRREGYWRMGADGEPLPYLDSIRFQSLPGDTATLLTALREERLHQLEISAPAVDAIRDDPNVEIVWTPSAYCQQYRMRCDKEPFNDKRVRNAIKICQDRETILEVSGRGYGIVADDHHASPIHPAYCPMDILPRDIDKAKALLAEAGYADGLDVTLACINQDPYKILGELLKEMCVPAGINITLDMMPSSMYWDQWMDVDFGISSWGHRPLAVMLYAAAYKGGVSWNETHWSNEEFDDLLEQAEGLYDVEERRRVMCELQEILRDDGGVGIPVWVGTLCVVHKKLKNFRPAPQMTHYNEVWLDPEA